MSSFAPPSNDHSPARPAEPTPASARKRRRASQRIADRLAHIRLGIENAMLDPDLRTVLAPYGYADEQLQHGRQLYQTVIALQQQHKAERGDALGASASRGSAWDEANTTYRRLCKLARVALKDRAGDQISLGLAGRRQRSYAGWIAQAQQFYTNALDRPELVSQLARFGVTESKLLAGQAQLAAVEATTAAHHRTRGQSQHTTTVRDDALRALRRWHADFIAVARVALADRPQALEKLGITVR